MKNKPHLVAREILDRYLLEQLEAGVATQEQVEVVSRLIQEGDVKTLSEIDDLVATPVPRGFKP